MVGAALGRASMIFRPWRRIRELEAEVARMTRSVNRYRRLRMHVNRNGKPKRALTEAEALELETRKANPSEVYTAYPCYCGAWHVGNRRGRAAP